MTREDKEKVKEILKEMMEKDIHKIIYKDWVIFKKGKKIGFSYYSCPWEGGSYHPCEWHIYSEDIISGEEIGLCYCDCAECPREIPHPRAKNPLCNDEEHLRGHFYDYILSKIDVID